MLRGVNNIGATQRIAMADLRALVEGLGFRDVRTLLNSGNIVFSVPHGRRGDVAGRIERALASRLGLHPRVTVLWGSEVAAVVRDNPFADRAGNPSSLLVMVPGKPSDRRRLEPLLGKRWHPEALAIGRRVAYLWCARGVAGSTLWPAVDRALGRTGTARNMATMTRLLALI
jgi:uncharacterized protein (DUF1697 family)